MKIGEVSRASGISLKRIRYYESIGLLVASSRTDANYRTYTEQDLHLLRFIKRARDLGFTFDQVRDLLVLWRDGDGAPPHVREVARRHADKLDKQMSDMAVLRDTLRNLSHESPITCAEM